MKRSEAARYARWSAMLALGLALITTVVYLRHAWVVHEQRKAVPTAPAQNVERQSNGLAFSKMEGERKIFTVEASKSTEFRNEDASLLEEVKITIFGQQSERHDVIRTHSCRYAKAAGSINCSGTVEMELQSAADAAAEQKHPGTAKPAGYVETRNVTFDQPSAIARTNELVTFKFPSGSGTANGVEYNSQLGTMKLLRDVKMSLVRSGGPHGHDGGNIAISGASLEFDRDHRSLHLAGPAHAQSETEQMDAGEITLILDEDYRAKKASASAGVQGKRPEIVSRGENGTSRVMADVLTAGFDADGWIKRLDASGDVQASREGITEEEAISAREAAIELWPEADQPKQIEMSGNVVVKTSAKNGVKSSLVVSRTLESEKVRAEFALRKGRDTSALTRAETMAPARIEWVDAAREGKAETQTALRAEKFALDVKDGRPSQITANGSVQVERASAGNANQTASGKRGVAQLVAGGGWSRIELHDDVKFKDGERSGQADDAVANRNDGTMTLTGHAIVRDASTETHASNFTFVQGTGDMRADGGVRSTAFPSKGGAVRFSGAPASITSEKMRGNAKTGQALYEGHARLWQGDAVLESDSIELRQKTKQLSAVGNVRGVFPQTAQRELSTSPQAGGSKRGNKSNLWHLASQTLDYYDAENRAHLEGNVVVQSESQRMRSGLMDLYFTPETPAAGPDKGANLAKPTKQIVRAAGSGGVTVEEQTRKATAERAEYTAAEGKFVMSGGNPTLFDGAQGTTTGRQLTFFLADDTIIVDSENGSRILTKHRVEK